MHSTLKGKYYAKRKDFSELEELDFKVCPVFNRMKWETLPFLYSNFLFMICFFFSGTNPSQEDRGRPLHLQWFLHTNKKSWGAEEKQLCDAFSTNQWRTQHCYKQLSAIGESVADQITSISSCFSAKYFCLNQSIQDWNWKEQRQHLVT